MKAPEIRDPLAPFYDWLRELPKSMQWLVIPPLVLTSIAITCHELFRPPLPGEPQEAFFFTLLLLVATILLTILLTPKPQIEDARPAGLGDFQFPTATEGRPVPLIFGRVRQRGPNVVWYGDLSQEAIQESVKTGLFSKKKVTKGFRYNVGVQFVISRGEGVTLLRQWIGKTEVATGTVSTETRYNIDLPELFGGDDLGNGGVQATCDFYPGNASQTVNAYLDDSSRQRIGTAATPTAPAYNGTCYVLARELTSAAPTANDKGAYLGNSPSIKAWSFEVERFPAIFSGQSAGQNKIGSADCNPANVIYEILTNDEWGFGFQAADIDVGVSSSFKTASDTLISEANGFSWLLDRQMSAQQMMEELQRQIDGVVYLSQTTGKWTIKLARDDYTLGTLPAVDDDNVTEVKDFTRASWEDTTNTIQVQYDKRDDDYKTSFALAQDMANAMIQGNGTPQSAQSTVGKVAFPGVKNSTLAAKLAWRELRGRSYPLATCKLVVNRQMWDLSIGDVVRWSNTQLGFVDLPMRISRINYGRLQDNKMELTVVQDVFQAPVASMGTPPPTGWTPPSVSLVAFPSDEQLAIEAPRAIVVRDPDYAGDPDVGKVLAAAARQGSEVAFDLTQRNSSGTPSGSYNTDETVYQFMRIGALASDLDAGTAVPTSTITITPDATNQTNLENAFDDTLSPADLGVDLSHLIYVGGEFMLVDNAALNASNVDLQNVYRGVCGTGQQNHTAGEQVYLVFVGAGITSTNIPNTNNIDVELRMKSSSATFAGSVTTISFTMAKKAMRPYPVGEVYYNGGSTEFASPDLEGDGSGLDGFGFDVDWTRRLIDVPNEVTALSNDVDPDTASGVSNTEYRVRVFVDPDGANTEVHTTAWASGSGLASILTRLEIVNEAAAGTELLVRVETRHDYNGETQLGNTLPTLHKVIPTSALSSQFYLGGKLRANVVSNSYTALQTGTYTVNIGSTFNSQIQYRLNGGTWTNLVGYTPGSSTTGTITGVTASDTIEIRHQTNPGSPNLTFLELQDTGATPVAYGVLSN